MFPGTRYGAYSTAVKYDLSKIPPVHFVSTVIGSPMPAPGSEPGMAMTPVRERVNQRCVSPSFFRSSSTCHGPDRSRVSAQLTVASTAKETKNISANGRRSVKRKERMEEKGNGRGATERAALSPQFTGDLSTNRRRGRGLDRGAGCRARFSGQLSFHP